MVAVPGVNPGEEQSEPLKLYCPPDFDAILEDYRQRYPDCDNGAELAKDTYDFRRGMFEGWHSTAHHMRDFIAEQFWTFQAWPQKDLGPLDQQWR